MAVTIHSDVVTAYGSATNTVITAPALISNGDILLIFYFEWRSGSFAAPATPSSGFVAVPGYTNPYQVAWSGGLFFNIYAWWKVASSESGNYTITQAITMTTQAYMAALSGADQTTPFTPNATQNTGTGTTSTATGLTTTAASELIFFIGLDNGDTANNLGNPSGTTPTFTKLHGMTANAGLIYVADGTLAAAGATGTPTLTNNSASGQTWVASLISVQPAAGAVPSAFDNWIFRVRRNPWR